MQRYSGISVYVEQHTFPKAQYTQIDYLRRIKLPRCIWPNEETLLLLMVLVFIPVPAVEQITQIYFSEIMREVAQHYVLIGFGRVLLFS